MRLVLAGAGHAHLSVLQKASLLRAAGVEPVLVAPGLFSYSGMATGVLSGALEPQRMRVDVAALAARAGVTHFAAEVTGADRSNRRLHLSDGRMLAYDALSLNLGSRTLDPHGLADLDAVWPVKPLARLLDLRDRVQAHLRMQGQSPAVVVAGGGPTGFEVAAALAGLIERSGARPFVHLICRSTPTWAPPRALERTLEKLRRRGVEILMGEVVARGPGHCRLADGRTLSCDALVLATGLEAPQEIRDLGLPVSQEGRLEIAPTLQSIADPTIFGAGDCAVIREAPRPPAGVFGVRAAPVLLDNLLSLGDGRAPRRYAPQKTWLSILDLGDGTGLAFRGGAWSLGRGALALKRRIDHGFVDRLRRASGEVLQD